MKKTRIEKPLKERFEEKYIKLTEFLPDTEHKVKTPCWVWTASLNRSGGYGKIGAGNKTLYAHRISYEFNVGPIPLGLEVCHRCDINHCVNPSHLWLGTHKENMVDRDVKNRHQCSRKLTKLQVEKIRFLYDLGNYTQDFLGSLFDVERSNISRIVNKNRWKHI